MPANSQRLSGVTEADKRCPPAVQAGGQPGKVRMRASAACSWVQLSVLNGADVKYQTTYEMDLVC